MKLRIGTWAGVSLLVAVGWALYVHPTFPSLIQDSSVVWNLALYAANRARRFSIPFRHWSLLDFLANALAYGFIGFMVGALPLKLHRT